MELDFGALHEIALPLDDQIYKQYSHLIPSKLDKAIDSRKREFLAGRYCAIMAAKSLGITLEQIPSHEDRSPVWPKTIVGSISHNKEVAIALVDLKSSSRSVGIDVETLIVEERIETIEKMVATPKELAFLKFFNKKLLAYTVLFSSKEALFKLIHPLAKVFFGFKEAELVSLDLDEGRFVLKITSDQIELKKIKRSYEGQFFLKDGRITSVLRL